ncbi:MAG: hypothetical protein R3B13_10630 [Polyangiaceae bacterium]
MRAWFALCFLLATACAPTQRTQTRTVLSVERRPLEDCREDHFAQATAVKTGVLVEVAVRRSCQRGMTTTRLVQTEIRERPDMFVWWLEFGGTPGWLALAALADDDGSTALVAIPIALGSFIASMVDLGDFSHRVTEGPEVETTALQLTREPLHAAADLPVVLALPDGRTLRATTNARGRAFLELPAELLIPGKRITLTLNAGSLHQDVEITIPEQPAGPLREDVETTIPEQPAKPEDPGPAQP